MSTQTICSIDDLIPNSGVCALVQRGAEEHQVALFYLPHTQQQIFAIGNWDPIGQANVLSRGIVGDVAGDLVVASPLYKQHFSLLSGRCLEQDISVPVYPVSIQNKQVVLS